MNCKILWQILEDIRFILSFEYDLCNIAKRSPFGAFLLLLLINNLFVVCLLCNIKMDGKRKQMCFLQQLAIMEEGPLQTMVEVECERRHIPRVSGGSQAAGAGGGAVQWQPDPSYRGQEAH